MPGSHVKGAVPDSGQRLLFCSLELLLVPENTEMTQQPKEMWIGGLVEAVKSEAQ